MNADSTLHDARQSLVNFLNAVVTAITREAEREHDRALQKEIDRELKRAVRFGLVRVVRKGNRARPALYEVTGIARGQSWEEYIHQHDRRRTRWNKAA